MKILLTGAGGFLGTAILDRLLARQFTHVRCLFRSRRDPQHIAALRQLYPHANIEEMQGNLVRRTDAECAMNGVDLIIHAAAAMRGAPADMALNTLVASRNLLDCVKLRSPAEQQRTRIVLISSFSVYGAAQLKRGQKIDENTPLEPYPERREPYAFVKLRQELLFQEYREKYGFELVVLRPGVIYGPGGGPYSYRVGMNLFGLFLHLGQGNTLPLTYVDNCGDAVVVASTSPGSAGQIFNIHDDDLLTSRQYLRAYRREVKRIPTVGLPYWLTMVIARLMEKYHQYSKGQLPAIFTPYIAAGLWKGTHFDNSKVRSLGWRPIVTTDEGLKRTFAFLRKI